MFFHIHDLRSCLESAKRSIDELTKYIEGMFYEYPSIYTGANAQPESWSL